MIKLTAIGNLGKDCTVNTVNGKTVINFNVAHTEKFKDNTGAQKDKTIWVECAYWTDRTAVAPYLKKGTQVYVEGTPDIRSYTLSDGRSGTSLTLRVQTVQLIGGRSNDDGQEPMQGNSGSYATNSNNNSNTGYNSGYGNKQGTSQNTQPDTITEPMDDLPF